MATQTPTANTFLKVALRWNLSMTTKPRGLARPAVAIAQHRVQEPLGVAEAAEAEMADIGLGGDESDGDALADLALAQIGVDHQGEFVGRAEAGRTLHRADNHRAGRAAEFFPAEGRLRRGSARPAPTPSKPMPNFARTAGR